MFFQSQQINVEYRKKNKQLQKIPPLAKDKKKEKEKEEWKE